MNDDIPKETLPNGQITSVPMLPPHLHNPSQPSLQNSHHLHQQQQNAASNQKHLVDMRKGGRPSSMHFRPSATALVAPQPS